MQIWYHFRLYRVDGIFGTMDNVDTDELKYRKHGILNDRFCQLLLFFVLMCLSK